MPAAGPPKPDYNTAPATARAAGLTLSPAQPYNP